MKKNTNNPYSKFRNGVERHVHHVATSASRSNSRYNLNDTHAPPDVHAVKQSVVHRCPHNPFTGNHIFALSSGDNQFGQDFTLYEALRTVDRLLRGQSFIKQAAL